MINQFKSLFDEIELIEHNTTNCEVQDANCMVKGNYRAMAKNDKDSFIYQGGFKVELILNDMDYWYFKNIHIEGFNPEWKYFLKILLWKFGSIKKIVSSLQQQNKKNATTIITY